MSSDAPQPPAESPFGGPDGRPDGRPHVEEGLRDARTLRPGSSIAVGVVGALAGAALLVPGLLTAPRSWALISTVVLGLVLLWLFVVRPCVVIHTEGIRLVNPLRVVDVTWPSISEVRSRWALELVVDGRRYTAWGVPADPGRPRYGRGMLGVGANKVRGKATIEAPTKSKVEAQVVAAEVEERMASDRKRKDGRTPRIAHQTWDPLSVGLLLAAVAFFVIGTFVV
ncbi:PH domain-containing protein [Terrabacter sp. C0L_2]|uniref:PH domain-containing protein n=1 Tax=Terrabacter sp. C0L_2 TaxID=3108389 RepID=UPI002ED625CA|nr:PH domain-containing protein [Terrabacter sp. C0L_2]